MRMAAASVCAMGMGIVLLTGCDQFSRVWGDEPGGAQSRTAVANSRPSVAKRTNTRSADRAAPQQSEDNSLQLIGLGEEDVRALFGPPTTADASGPGKTWRYRNGRCTLNLSFYPDVETRVYRTLAYEVTSDDNDAERKRVCLSQFQSVARTR